MEDADSVAQPNHLLVLVHGILASPNEWKHVERELKEKVGPTILVFTSRINAHFLTLDGIDASGRRLAAEVQELVAATSNLSKISFMGHSLGGLLARYAVGVLLEDGDAPKHAEPKNESQSTAGSQEFDYECIDGGAEERSCASEPSTSAPSSGRQPAIAGLEPINFITLATPHLGVRGNKQLPFLFGNPFFERFAPPLAPFIVGTTGRQLFLADGTPAKPPLLVRMTYDCPEAPFISALRAFQLRILYANAGCDHMVGWRTSSIRREEELPKLPKFSFQPRIQRVLHVEESSAVPATERHYPPKRNEAAAMLAQRPPQIRTRSTSLIPRANFRLSVIRSFREGDASASGSRRASVSSLNRARLLSFRSFGKLSKPISARFWGEPQEQQDQKNIIPAATHKEGAAEFESKEAAFEHLEEEMVTGLQQVTWRKIDASLRDVFRPLYAHHNIHNWAARTPEEVANFTALLASASHLQSAGVECSIGPAERATEPMAVTLTASA